MPRALGSCTELQKALTALPPWWDENTPCMMQMLQPEPGLTPSYPSTWLGCLLPHSHHHSDHHSHHHSHHLGPEPQAAGRKQRQQVGRSWRAEIGKKQPHELAPCFHAQQGLLIPDTLGSSSGPWDPLFHPSTMKQQTWGTGCVSVQQLLADPTETQTGGGLEGTSGDHLVQSPC